MKRAALAILALGVAAGSAPAAQRTAAELQLANFQQAMEMFYLDTNRLTTIENLDDIFDPNAEPPHQWINNGGGALVLRPEEGVPFRQVLTEDEYQGPYLSYPSGAEREDPDGDYDEGTPLDPWGNPYYFYSPLGLIEPKQDGLSLRYYGDQFDTYTFVSHGPDGVPSENDVIRSMGLTVTEPAVSSATLTVEIGNKDDGNHELLIRGYVLGADPGEILFDGEPSGVLPDNWSGTEVRATMTEVPDSAPMVSVSRADGTETRSAEMVIEEDGPPTAVDDWWLY